VSQLCLEFTLEPPVPRRLRPRRSFHVRSSMAYAEVLAGEGRASTQETAVLAYFESRRSHRLTPWDVSDALGIFIVSTRRAITNLCNAGLLVMHPSDRRLAGPYGQKSCTWEVAGEPTAGPFL
jgi:hypothetical protein